MHRSILVIAVVCGSLASAAAAATPSPVGSWTRSDGLVYRFDALAGGGYARFAMTPHRTATNHCLVAKNTLVYRYHPLGKGVFSVDSLYWTSGCKTHWESAVHKLKIAATATKLTLSCFDDVAHTCWTYHRAKAAVAVADTKAPVVRAVYSAGVVSGVTSLRYTVTDDSGKTWEAISLYKDGVIARRYKTTLGPAVKGRMYGYKLMKTPASFRGTFAFCIVSHDAAGHASEQSCETVTIR